MFYDLKRREKNLKENFKRRKTGNAAAIRISLVFIFLAIQKNNNNKRGGKIV
jgi:hypothetical protein